jgi:FlaA1/EpsC-like NDP-sugar epimerase
MDRRKAVVLRRFVTTNGAALYARRRHTAWAAYAGLTAISYAFAYLLRFEFSVPADQAELLALTVLPLVAIRLVAFRAFGMMRERWRFAGGRNMVRLAGAVATGSAVALALNLAASTFVGGRVSVSILVIEGVFTCFFVAGAWLSYRIVVEAVRQMNGKETPRRVLVIGAGEAGTMLVREMCRFPTGYVPVGFVDDDPYMQSTSSVGVPVLGRTADLAGVVARHDVEELIIAVPSAAPTALRRIVRQCELTGLPFKVLPGIREVLNGDVALAQIREVRIEDLLGREPIQLELPELEADLAGRTILITGAAGSIGSELSRQVALHRPARIVALDQAETPLFFLDMELRGAYPDVEIIPVVADVASTTTMREVFERFRPSHVFHAAAYKHVPLMEAHPVEATRNNVFGTYCVAQLAGEFGATKFVLVSTDKAVRPANVMGATKRLAELVVTELQWRYRSTTYGAVRFGNVLGSAGSVIPIFRRQLDANKPLTVTHPDTTRFFMTIPEAVQLILQASLLRDFRGRIAMLEMGEPVRIVDLAENLLRLAGRTSRHGEDIVFSGLRPGEKLHEELVAPDEEAIPTAVPRVRMLIPRTADTGALVDLIQSAGGGARAEAGLLERVDALLLEHGGTVTGAVRPRKDVPATAPSAAPTAAGV